MIAKHMFKNLFGRSNGRARGIGIGEWAGRRFWESKTVLLSLYCTVHSSIKLDNNSVQATSRKYPYFQYAFLAGLWVFLIVATILFTVISILGGHYIHRKRQFRLEQAVATEEIHIGRGQPQEKRRT